MKHATTRALPPHVQRLVDAAQGATAPTQAIKLRRRMNKTEQSYSFELERRKACGEVKWWAFEKVKLKLATGAYYKPDFMVLLSSGETEFHEVKGFWREAARVRIKVAAGMYPYRFVVVKALRLRDGGGFSTEEIAP